ncbi:hypothetical protein V3F56_02690 [Moorellaceae bacterium AZ2]
MLENLGLIIYGALSLALAIVLVRTYIIIDKWNKVMVLFAAPRIKPHKSIFGEWKSIEVKGPLNICEELKTLGETNVATDLGACVTRWTPHQGMKLELAALCPNGPDEVWSYYHLTLQDGVKKWLILKERLRPQREAFLEMCEGLT